MQFYKTFGGALKSAFDESKERDDNKKKIISDEKPMSRAEYVEFKSKELQKKINNLSNEASK